jgi:hypothetical protein
VASGAVAGCSGSSSPAPSPTITSSSPTESPSASGSPTSSATTPTPTLTSSPSSSAGVISGEPACPTRWLALRARIAGAAAGTEYVSVVLTNTGRRACSLFGYPGVSFLDDADNQIGMPAQRDKSSKPRRIVLAPADKAHAIVSFPNPGVFGSGCGERQSATVRVYPPGQTAALTDGLRVDVCGDEQGRAAVGAMRPGTRGL